MSRVPFSLGLPGEYWSNTLHSLIVPVGGKHVVLVQSSDDQSKFTVVKHDCSVKVDSALMAAALVYEVLESYQGR